MWNYNLCFSSFTNHPHSPEGRQKTGRHFTLALPSCGTTHEHITNTVWSVTNWKVKHACYRWMHVCTMIHKSRTQSNTTATPPDEMSVEQVGEITQGTVILLYVDWPPQQSVKTRRGRCLNSVGGRLVRPAAACDELIETHKKSRKSVTRTRTVGCIHAGGEIKETEIHEWEMHRGQETGLWKKYPNLGKRLREKRNKDLDK